MSNTCPHLTPEHVHAVQPSALGCEDCLQTGDTWVHLRICSECGHVGCCDSSPNKHATQHFHTSQHPIIQSFEPEEEWGWCYPDQLYLDSLGPAPNQSGRHYG